MTRTQFLSGAIRTLYGGEEPDTCDECRFSFLLGATDARAMVGTVTADILGMVAGTEAGGGPPDGSWNATGYVAHLADLARGWAERWAQLQVSPGTRLVGWDPDELAAARDYCNLPMSLTTWSLGHGVAALEATGGDLADETRFEHDEWGEGDVADGYRWLAHEWFHHRQDIARLV